MHVSASTRRSIHIAAEIVLIAALFLNPLAAVTANAISTAPSSIEQEANQAGWSAPSSRATLDPSDLVAATVTQVNKANKVRGDDSSGPATYIVVLNDAPLASYKGEVAGFAATDATVQGRTKLDVQSAQSQAYMQYLDQRQSSAIDRMNLTLGRSVEVIYTYKASLNGYAAVMSAEEASRVEKLPGVKRVIRDWVEYAQTDVGPTWIGAPSIWGGDFTDLHFTAELSGTNEVPAVDTDASGTATLDYNFDTKELHYEVQVTNIVSITLSHIHSGTVGVNGPVLHMLYDGTGEFDPDHPISGTVTLSEEQQAQLVNAALYVNVHTEAHGGGEIRGQILPVGTMGEGMVVGVIDTGINIDHPSFADIGGDGYNHTNARGKFYGWCDPASPDYDPNLVCNDKLIGVWSADDDSPEDAAGHGSHTASTAAGNMIEDVEINAPTTSITVSRISGVAPHANVIAYNIEGTPGSGSSAGSSTIAATDQAILDEVDVINYSFGSGPFDPWLSAENWFNVREAGIFVATSAANDGPGPATIGSPANAPWLLTVGASSHNRQFSNALINLTGGNTTPPADILGEGVTSGLPQAPIVYAGAIDPNNVGCDIDYEPGTFIHGEIVVCDYNFGPQYNGRVNKSINLEQAGAGGFILINNPDFKAALMVDSYAIPGLGIPFDKGEALKVWLATGSGHMGEIRGVLTEPAQGDIMAGFSSRGPNGPVPDVIKPDVSAPGRRIVAAIHTTDPSDPPEFDVFQGTSMSSPHAAGAATLLRAIHPEWTPAEVQSALMTTAITAGVLKEDAVTPADPFDIGAGRINLTLAMDAGLVLDEDPDALWDSNPAEGGDPRTLNLASMADDQCLTTCSWTRTVKSTLDVQETWNVTTSGGNGATVSVEPEQFTIDPGATQELVITANVSGAPFDEWSFGEVQLTPAGTSPAAHLPVAFVSTVSVFPEDVDILTRRNAGSQLISGLKALEITDLTVQTYGLSSGDRIELSLGEDATEDDPYDNINDGTVSVTFVEVPAGALRLAASILASEAPDVDMFVGTGTTPSEDTEECVSATAVALESCVVNNPEPGTWWILVQNFDASGTPPDAITLSIAQVTGDVGNFSVEGPESVPSGQPFDVRLFYDVPTIQAGETWYGAFTLGTDPAHPGNLGTIFVNLVREADDVTKVASVDVAAPGDTVSYQIDVATNVTPEDLAYTIEDAIPQGLTYVEGSATASAGTVTVEGNTLTWTGVMTSPTNLQGKYLITTNQNDEQCDTPFGGYVDLESLAGFKTDPGVEGDTVGFTYGALGGTDFYGSKRTAPPFLTDDGFVLFGQGGDEPWINQELPDPTAPNGLFAAYWRDMEIVYDEATNKGLSVATAAGGSLWLAEFDDIQGFDDPDTHLDLEIFAWKDADASRGSYDAFYAFDNVVVTDTIGTIGVENDAGNAATQFSYDDFTPTDGLVFCLDFVGAEPVQITYDVTVDADAPGGLVANTAFHNTDQPGSQPAGATAGVEIVGLEVDKSADVTEALIGQTITYTYRITNTSNVTLTTVAVDDRTGAVDDEDVDVGPQETRTATASYLVQGNDAPGPVVNTVTVTGTADAGASLTITASASVSVVLPVLSWASSTFTVNEEAGTFDAGINVSPPNPYSEIGVQVIVTYSNESEVSAMLVQDIVIPPGTATQTVTIDVPDDDVYAPGSIQLGLQSPTDAVVGGSNGGIASVTILDDEAALGLVASNVPDKTQADVGETITYTYRITNTGNVTLTTIVAQDTLNRVGILAAVPELEGELAPSQTRTATVSYVAQQADTAAPLVNTLTVTGTEALGGSVTSSAASTVTVGNPTNLPEEEQPQQGNELFLPRLEN